MTADEKLGGMGLVTRLLALCGLSTKWKQTTVNDTRTRIHTLDPASVTAMVARSQAHQERLQDPDKARLAWKAIELPPPPPPTAEEMVEAKKKHDAMIDGILSQEYPLAA